MKWTRIASGATAALVLFEAGAAGAQEQPWLADRRYREGIGYRVGDLELHPGIAGEFGYDSNFYQRADGEDPVGVYQLRITPSLSLSTLEAQRRGAAGVGAPPQVEFRAEVAGTYNEYIAQDSDERDKASEFRNVGARAGFTLDILPQRPWGATFYGNLVRTIQPSNLSDVSAAYNRVNLQAGGELVWAPGGGLFDWRWGYEYGSVLWEKDRFTSLNNATHILRTRGRWRFLPRSALMFDASQSFLRYSNPGNSTYLLDSDPLRARLGFNGLVTRHVGLLALAGWGVTFTKGGSVPAENYDGPIGQAQVTFYPTPAPGLVNSPREASLTLSSVALGYHRDFQTSYFGSFYSRDRGYLTVSYFFAGRVLVVLDGGVASVHHPTLYFSAAGGGPALVRTDEFSETHYDASLFAEYRMISTVGINTTFGYEKSDSRTLPADPTGTFRDDLSFDRLKAFLGVRWFM
jgi:hypothetical protein